MPRLAFVAVFLVLLGCQAATKASKRSGEGEPVVAGEGEEIADADVPLIADGTSYYGIQSGKLARYRCTAAQIAAVPDAATLDDATTLEAHCSPAPPAAGAPAVAAFTAALSAAYLRLVEDEELNELEFVVLRGMTESLAGASAAPVIDRASRPAAAAIEARFAGLFDDVYDGKAAGRPAEREGAPPSGLGLADTITETSLGSGRFSTTFTEGRTVGLTLTIRGTMPAVDTLLATTRREGSTAACGAAVVGIAKATAPDGSTVALAAHPSTPRAFRVNGGKALKLGTVQVAVRRGPNTYGQSCILEVRGQTTTSTTYTPPPLTARDRKMKALMGKREHRLWHFLWHGVRNAWPALTLAQKKSIRDTLGSGWGRKDAETTTRPEANKGEEFLHMHRGMLAFLKKELGNDMYVPWPEPPAPQSRTFPVPAGNTAESDADYRDRLLPWHQQTQEPGRLRQITLAAFGVWLETGLHNSLHNRFSDPAKKDLEQMRDLFQRPAPAWDVPESDYLGSTYSAHVNPIFYALHGYIDARIEDWRRANGYDTIEGNCAGKTRCYQWKGVWDGPSPATGVALTDGHAAHGADLKAFETLPKSLKRLIRESSHMIPDGDVPDL